MNGCLEDMRNLTITQVQAIVSFIRRDLHPGDRDRTGRADSAAHETNSLGERPRQAKPFKYFFHINAKEMFSSANE